MLRSKKFLINLLVLNTIIIFLLLLLTSILTMRGWTSLDYFSLDIAYQWLLKLGFELPRSDRIIYVTITDKTYKEVFMENKFQRSKFADFLDKLNEFSPEAVCVDLIFHEVTDSLSDLKLEKSFSRVDRLFLPVSYSLAQTHSKNLDEKMERQIIESAFLFDKKYSGRVLYGENPILQKKEYLDKADRVGHINEIMDDDGVFRHSNLIIQVDSLLFPSLALSTFLGIMNIPSDRVLVKCNQFIKIPALKNSWLNDDIFIPIDENGRYFIPFVGKWGNDFPNVSIEKFLELYENTNTRNELTELFEGKIVIIGDISNNSSNYSATTIDKNSPVLSILANSLNGLLVDISYKKLNFFQFIVTIFTVMALLSISISFKNQLYFIVACVFILSISIVFCFIAMINLLLIPLATILISLLSYIIILSINSQSFLFKENKVIEIINLRRNYEFEEASKIQISMLPKTIPNLPFLEITHYFRTATEVGGDFYDFHVLKDESLLIALGDATGHGLKAGTMVTVTKSLFTELKDRYRIEELLPMMNRTIRKLNLHMLYMSLLLAKVEQNKLTYTSAGMPPILVFKHNERSVEELIIKSPPLGGFSNFYYPIITRDINEGDLFFMMSDGLIELFNSKKEMLGSEKIKKKLKECAEKDLESIKSEIINLIKTWNDNKIPNDDITFIIARLNPSTQG